uniref:Protein kinase domain-containing protein n=1 Tax=Oryza brachyantha TaxID=4533 RepID=J3LA19_ORYBR
MSATARRKAGLPADFDAEVYGAMEALTLVEEALLADTAIAAAGEEVQGLVGAVGSGSGADEIGQKSAGEAGEANEGDAVKQDEDDDGGEEEEEEEEDGNEMVEEEDDDNDNDNDNEGTQVDGGNATASDGGLVIIFRKSLFAQSGFTLPPEVSETEENNELNKSQIDGCQLANKLQENAQHIHMLLKEEAGEGQNHNIAISSDAMETTRQKADELIKSLGGLVSYLNQFTDLIKENGFENVVGSLWRVKSVCQKFAMFYLPHRCKYECTPELRFVDVSGNNLSGPIPEGLSRFNASMFSGNEHLCGKPLDVACDTFASPSGMSTFMTIAVVLIIVGVILAAAGIATGVLGSGNFGSSYKATLCEGPAVVVKRFKEMNGVGREDFSEHMRRLGRLTHPNLLPVVAYLYKKEEKLLITDYMDNGSLAQVLHGNRGAMLDWGKRLRIIRGTARGLAHLYDELPMLTVPHGHLKSSNVLLDGGFEAVLSDYALVPVVTAQHARQVMVAYKAPECVAAQGKPSKKSDVWSLGILILEVLTGKFPANYLRQQGRQGTSTTDLAGWVSSVVSEERTGEVFDKDMAAGPSGKHSAAVEADMLKLLHADVDQRWDLKTALARVEEIRDPDPAAADPSPPAADSGEPRS